MTEFLDFPLDDDKIVLYVFCSSSREEFAHPYANGRSWCNPTIELGTSLGGHNLMIDRSS